MSLVARHLEANGIPTVILGSARDIVEHCGVPRFLFTDFPLGNPCGAPWDAAMQRRIVASALDLFEDAPGPRTTVPSPEVFVGDPSWRQSYMRIDPSRLEALRRAGEQRRALQDRAKREGRVRIG